MPKYPAISFGLLSPTSFKNFDNALILFELWHQLVPSTFPSLFGVTEPLREKLNFDCLNELRRFWHFSVYFKRSKFPRLHASIAIEDQLEVSKNHSTLSAFVERTAELDTLLGNFITASAVGLDCHFGYVHRVNESEAKFGLETNSTSRYVPDGEFRTLTIFSPQLKRGIPNLFWITILGKPYVELIGREKIDSCPVKNVQWLTEHIVLLQLTDSVDDSFEKEAEFEYIRLKAKEHLGIRFFQPNCRQTGGVLVNFE